MKRPTVYVIAGPNGSGKTTFAKKYLSEQLNITNFINADLIAQGLSPLDINAAAFAAGRIVLQRIKKFSEEGKSFAFETTLSGKTYVNTLKRLKSLGYEVEMTYLWLPSLSEAKERVKNRVKQGGHDVPIEDQERRFESSLRNLFFVYRSLIDHLFIFNNGGIDPDPVLRISDNKIKIYDNIVFEQIKCILRIENL